MMTDTAFLSSSPWLSELWPPRDSLLTDDYNLVPELPFHHLETDSSVAGTDLWGATFDAACAPSDISLAPSDMSDAASLDLDLEERMYAATSSAGARGSGLLTSAVVSAITDDLRKDDLSTLSYEITRWQDGLTTSDRDDDGDTDNLLYSDSDDSDTDDDDTTSSVSAASPRKRSTSETLSHSTKWSQLSPRDQRQLVEDLSTLISSQLGLREQLEVIRIINPRANVSPTDTEFVIDMSCLCDEKLTRVQTFVKQHLHQNKHNNNNNNSSSSSHCHHNNNNNNTSRSGSNSRVHHKPHLSERSAKFCCHDDRHNAANEGSAESGTSRRRRGAKHPPNLPPLRERRRLERKRSRQDLKERRSGLFDHEEVVTVSTRSTAYTSDRGTDDDDDDLDIDILT